MPKTFKKKTLLKKKRALKSKRPKRSLKKMVKTMIQRSAEKKTLNYVNLNTSITGCTHASAASLVIPVSPYPAYLDSDQGSSSDERIGNRIRLTSLKIKGSITPLRYDATTNIIPKPVVVQMFVFYDKQYPNVVPDPYGAGDFFQVGSGQSGFRDDLVDLWAPINEDRYKVVLRKQFKVGYASYEGTGIQVADQAFGNNDFKFNQEFNIDLLPYVVKNVVFNDNTSQPTTRGLFCFWCAVSATGGTLTATQIPAHVQYSLDGKFTDL